MNNKLYLKTLDDKEMESAIFAAKVTLIALAIFLVGFWTLIKFS
jgi:hypothetical protein